MLDDDAELARLFFDFPACPKNAAGYSGPRFVENPYNMTERML